MKTMYDIIKKQKGEHFAKAIRAYDNGIFDIPNLDKIVKFAGYKAEPIMDYLVSLKDVKIKEQKVHQHPIDLLRKAGYTAYYADTLEKQNWPKQFYAKGEELCTFRDPNRYKDYHIIVAIKKNVADIKRENFTNPKREDEYGTSVLQIQILKSGGFISIKNRYNHTVENPDNTFNSDPDKIIEGLSDAIKHYYNVDFASQKVRCPEGYIVVGKQLVAFHSEFNNVYFGENCYVQNGIIHPINKQKELIVDHIVLNLQDRTVKNPSLTDNSFRYVLEEEIKDKKLQIVINEKGNKCLQANGKNIIELENGKLKSICFDTVQKIGKNFLVQNRDIESLTLTNVTEIGDNFIYWNKKLNFLSLPQVKSIGNSFLLWNEELDAIDLPNVYNVGNNFLMANKKLKSINMPQLTIAGDGFLVQNYQFVSANLPKLEKKVSKEIVATVEKRMEPQGKNKKRNLKQKDILISLKNKKNRFSR